MKFGTFSKIEKKKNMNIFVLVLIERRHILKITHENPNT